MIYGIYLGPCVAAGLIRPETPRGRSLCLPPLYRLRRVSVPRSPPLPCVLVLPEVLRPTRRGCPCGSRVPFAVAPGERWQYVCVGRRRGSVQPLAGGGGTATTQRTEGCGGRGRGHCRAKGSTFCTSASKLLRVFKQTSLERGGF